MKIDVDGLVAKWVADHEANERAQRQYQEERQKLRDQRQQERKESVERDFRRRASAIAAILENEYTPKILHSWFLRDLWTVEEALILLCGYDPDSVPIDQDGRLGIELRSWPIIENSKYNRNTEDPSILRRRERIRTLDGLRPYDEMTKDAIGRKLVQSWHIAFLGDYDHLMTIWCSGAHAASRNPPEYYISWAIRKKFAIPWLDWATRESYYIDSTASPTSVTTEGLERPFSTNERRTMLVLIAALCKKIGIDTASRSAAGDIERLVDALELAKGVSAETIRKRLAEIPEAIGPRSK